LQELFEAEYAWINNFNLTQNSVVVPGQGIVVADSMCSGRAKVCSLGNSPDNYIEFRDICANTAGRYHLTISYLSGNNKNATLTVNGTDTLLTNLNSGGSKIIGKQTYPVLLNKGFNTIRITNATQPLPDIDKIQLDLNPVTFEDRAIKFIRKVQKFFKPR
jgi:hypothetical protein